MRRLKFYAREDQLVFVPYITVSAGAPERYVGRRFDAKLRGYPATKEPFTCDADSNVGERLVLLTRRDSCLWPADDETAQACGMRKAPELKYASGAWVAKSSPLPESDELPEPTPLPPAPTPPVDMTPKASGKADSK
jgi:hypothetical protein